MLRRIGVVSDTHGNPECFRKALRQMGQVDFVIHAGDHYRDAVEMSRETGIKTVAVIGNCDWGGTGTEEEELEIDGYRIMVTHGHRYGAKSGNSLLAEKLRQEKYDLIIYGHSHVPEITHLPEGYLLNPGSVSRPRQGTNPSYAVVEIGKKGLIPYIHELNG